MTTTVSIGFAGSKRGTTLKQRDRVREILGKLHEEYGAIKGHFGDCIGSDTEFRNLCRIFGREKVVLVSHPPKDTRWRAFCEADETREEKPFLERYRDIVNESNLLIVTPKNQSGEILKSGTWATIRYARKKGKKVFVIRPDGKIEQ